MPNCTRCLLPAQAPGADVDPSRRCAFCRGDRQEQTVSSLQRDTWNKDLEQALTTTRGPGAYDVLLGFSGGKDSVFLLHRLVHDYHLRVLAMTTADGLTKTAQGNIQQTLASIPCDHVLLTTPRQDLDRIFRLALSRQDPRGAIYSVCYICGPLKVVHLVDHALAHRIPLVVLGYSPGQPDPALWHYELPGERLRTRLGMPEDRFRLLQDHGFIGGEDPLGRLLDPARFQDRHLPRLLAPLHVWEYDQDAVIDQVVRLGLIPSRHRADPVHTNCDLNWLLMASDLRNLGYIPYLEEFSRLLRLGKADRGAVRRRLWLARLLIATGMAHGRHVRRWLRRLDLTPQDLRIAATATATGNATHEAR